MPLAAATHQIVGETDRLNEVPHKTYHKHLFGDIASEMGQLHLLEAENFSFHNNHEEAKASYAAAITSARCSRFIHEQALGKQNLWLDSDSETKFYM